MNSTTLVRKWVWRCTAISLFLIVVVFLWRLLAASQATLTTPVPKMNGGRFAVPNLETSEEKISSSGGKTLPVVYGFLPYWNLNHFNLNRVITHLAYFSFGLDAQGNFLENEPGYRSFYGENFQDIANRNLQAGNKNELVVSLFDADDIVSFLNCGQCQANFYEQAVAMVRENHLSGLNIDFEYLGEVTPKLRQNYTAFLKGLKGTLARNNLSQVQISVDIYGEGASMYNLWEMEEISEVVDYIVIMAYDYKTRRSTVPGPTAPVLGKDEWGGDILGSLQKLLEKVPPEKVILALPFYGYEWQVTELDLDSAKTFDGTGATLTYKRLQELLSNKSALKLTQHWDERSLTPYISYVEDDEYFIGFFENERSLSYKIDLASGLNLGGVAIWAMGYEGDASELWQVIEKRK